MLFPRKAIISFWNWSLMNEQPPASGNVRVGGFQALEFGVCGLGFEVGRVKVCVCWGEGLFGVGEGFVGAG